MGMAAASKEGQITRRVAVDQHLRYNMSPPVGDCLDLAMRAIELVEAGDSETLLRVPSGRDLSAVAVVEGLRLEFFL
jgi:hypothetical protein